ncbi:MAG: hypothetical protein HY235_09150 [Acidobacteria bacterium]|nr:hypothetical protein [Acidobacteriota bacterium]
MPLAIVDLLTAALFLALALLAAWYWDAPSMLAYAAIALVWLGLAAFGRSRWAERERAPGRRLWRRVTGLLRWM